MELLESKHEIESLYTRALEQYLAEGSESALRGAYEVGRFALAKDLGVLGMVTLHQSALLKLLGSNSAREEIQAKLGAATQFFAESLSSYEMAHRGYRDAVASLRLVNETLEQEAKRIAHAVHDEAGQLLFAVHLAMAEMAREATPALQGRIREVTAVLEQVEEHLRGLSHELRPVILDDLGLVPAVGFLIDRFSRRFGLVIEVKAELESRLPPMIETTLYRIIQEALNNVTRHSAATNVWVQLDGDAQTTRCSIRDNGVGFDPCDRFSESGRTGLGLIGIRERLSAIGGTLQVTSQPGKGVLLLITVPKENSHANPSRPCR
jgi:signal transduction histidine kinase